MKIFRDRRSKQDHALQICSSRLPQAADKIVNDLFGNHLCPRYQLPLDPPPPDIPPPPNPPKPPPPPPPPNPPPPQPPRDPPPPNIPEKRIQKSTLRSGVNRITSMTIISRITPPADMPLPR